MHAHTHVYSCVSFAGGLIPLPFVPSDACRRVAPCSRPCRPCRMNWTALERTTSNSMRKSNFCRATQAEYVWEILSDVQFGLLAQNKPSLGVSVADECLIWIGLPSLLCFLPAAGWRQRRHRDALLLPVRGKTGSVCFLQQEGESHTLEIK